MKNPLITLARCALAALLLAVALVAEANPSNKWRLEFNGRADSDGVIVLRLTPKGGEPQVVEFAITKGTGENAAAKAVVKGLKAQLPKDDYHVERDDWEDVLIKKRLGSDNFDLEIVSNSVKGIKIKPKRE